MQKLSPNLFCPAFHSFFTLFFALPHAMVIIDVAIELFHEYKYYLGWAFLFNFVLNLVVALGLRVYQLERKLKGQASCCVGDQRPASKEAAEENVACEAVNEDWVTARLERSTSGRCFWA